MGSAPRAALAKAIPHRRRAGVWLGLALAVGFALLLGPVVTAERWLGGPAVAGEPAPLTVRVPLLAGFDTPARHVGGGVVVARGEVPTPAKVAEIDDLAAAMPRGVLLAAAIALLLAALAAIFTHHMRRSTYGRLLRVQLASLGAVALVAVGVKALLLTTPISILVAPVALFALVPTLCLDRVVGLATGVLAALVLAILAPFDLGVAILLLVQVAVAGLVVAERPKRRWPAALAGGAAATVCTAVTFPVLSYLTTGHLPASEMGTWQTPWLAAALGPAIATILAVPLVPLYQRLVGEITGGGLVELEDLANPLLVQIAQRSPGTWQHSLAMANLAEIAANAIGANGRLVRVGAYYHDLGKSLAPNYFIENLEPGESSPHDQMPPEASCDAIFKHVTDGLATARRAGLHERIIDFMHMHHGNGVLEYFWARCREQGNPNGLTIEDFRYPGVPPQSRETAILAICDAVEAAARTLKKPEAAAIDSLVQRIVYGKLHLGQLDDSGLSMADLRRVADSLRETIRHANHGRIEYPWQREAAASASVVTPAPLTQTGPRLDSLDLPARPDSVAPPRPTSEAAVAVDGVGLSHAGSAADGRRGSIDGVGLSHAGSGADGRRGSGPVRTVASSGSGRADTSSGPQRVSSPEALAETANVRGGERAPTVPPPTEAALAVDAVPREAPGRPSARALAVDGVGPPPAGHGADRTGGPIERISDVAISETAPALARPTRADRRTGRNRAQTPADSFPAIEVIEPPRPPDTTSATKPMALVVDDMTEEPTPVGMRTLPPPGAIRKPSSAPPPIAVPRAPTPGARKRAATLPPIASRRASTMPPAFPPPGFEDDPAVTTPRLPRSPSAPPPRAALNLPDKPWATGLAKRIDAAIDHFEDFGGETPMIAPTAADLRALLGEPDPTKRLSVDELERLHFEARTTEPDEPEILQVRRISSTTEVDPDDIESAVEIAPPARRGTLSVGTAKKKLE